MMTSSIRHRFVILGERGLASPKPSNQKAHIINLNQPSKPLIRKAIRKPPIV